MQDFKAVTHVVADLKAMQFPPDDDGIFAIVKMFCQMADRLEQVEWTVQRCLALYAKWPGAREVRAVFCSRWKPLDGVEVSSEIYTDGIPSTLELARAEWRMQIPAGATREPLQLEGPALELAQRLGTPAIQKPKYPSEIDPERRKWLEAEIAKAEEENRQKRAKGELKWDEN